MVEDWTKTDFLVAEAHDLIALIDAYPEIRDWRKDYKAHVPALISEVERLKEQVTRLDAYITYRDYDREILDENTRLREEVGRLRSLVDAVLDAGLNALDMGDHYDVEIQKYERMRGIALAEWRVARGREENG